MSAVTSDSGGRRSMATSLVRGYLALCRLGDLVNFF